jgi:hypothetical protein
MTDEKRDYLETLIRQQSHWFVEANGGNAELIERRRAKLIALKQELGVTDEQAFIDQCQKERDQAA